MHGRSVLIRSTVGSFSKLLFARAACLRLIVRVQRACVGKDQTEGAEEDLAAEEEESLQFAQGFAFLVTLVIADVGHRELVFIRRFDASFLAVEQRCETSG